MVDNKNVGASELAKLREQYSTVRREREQLLAEVTNVRALSEKDAAARREEVAALKGIIERHMMEEMTTSTCSCRIAGDCTNIHDTIRALKVDVAELTATSNTLSDENADLRAALDASESSREAMLSAHEQALAELLTESALIEADKQRALRQISLEKKGSEEHAQEARFAISALAEAKERVATLEHELLRHRQVSDSTIDQLKSDSNAKFKLITMERDDLKERVAALEEMILCEASSSSSSSESSTDQGGVFEADACTSNNTRERLILLQRQYSQLEHQVFQLESERGNVEAENKRLLHACDACKLDNEMISRQKEALANQCSLVERRLELQSDDACKVKAEMERTKSESEANKERAIELEERYDAIEEDKGIMKIKLERIEKDLLSAGKRQVSSEKALEKEVQRAALYRQKALEAHERSQRAKEALACLTLDVSEN